MYVTVAKFYSNSAYTTEENAAWPLDSALLGIKAKPTAKSLIQCSKIQVQLCGFKILYLSAFQILLLCPPSHFNPPLSIHYSHSFSLAQQSA